MKPSSPTPSQMSTSNVLSFWLNGEKVELTNPDPTLLLSHYLHSIGLTGTKVACWQGGCGACTVMLSWINPATSKAVHKPVNACLRPVCSLDGLTVTTVEGLGSVHDELDPVQYSIAKHNGSQCGFCTPGFVMNTHAYLQGHPQATAEDLESIYGGNLCRCTGYRPILEGVRALTSNYVKPLCCSSQVSASCVKKCSRSQECQIDPSFPIKVKKGLTSIALAPLPKPHTLHFKSSEAEWVRPTSLQEVMQLKKSFPQGKVKLVFGNTAYGIYAQENHSYFIDISRIPELSTLREEKEGVTVGATTSIQELHEFSSSLLKTLKEEEATGLKALVSHLHSLAGLQIRSAGSVAGNICITKDHDGFPSDLFTVLATLGSTVTIASGEYPQGSSTFDLLEMPPTASLPPDAVIVSFFIPYTKKDERVATYRLARRSQMAHPVVTAGFRATLGGKIHIIYGGLANQFRSCPETEQFLEGKVWDAKTLEGALAKLKAEIASFTIPMEEEGFTLKYRLQIAEHYFYKFFSQQPTHQRPLSIASQEHYEYPDLYPLTQPILKRAAFVQASGEMKYTHDIPLPSYGLHGVIVMSSRPHAKFSFKNLEKLKEIPGFKDFITASDIPSSGSKVAGLGGDDPIFCDGVATSVGAPLGMALSTTLEGAKKAADFIAKEGVIYEDLPAVITLREAIEKNTQMPMIRTSKDPDEDIQQYMPALERSGSNQAWLKDPSHPLEGSRTVSGTVTTPAAAHFYLETQCALATPGSYDQWTIHSSTQNPNGTQATVAKVLGIPLNQVTVVLEQIGGGFGGKQHRANLVAAQAAVGARKWNLPVRLLYDRATDMQMVGKHHPYEGTYRVSFTDEGKITALKLDLKTDAGDTYDCSFAVMDLSLLSADGAYNVETFQVNGACYKTNKTSNTALRTFGVMQGWTILETVIERVAFEVSKKVGRKVLAEEIREKNMYRNGTPESYDKTHFGQELDFCTIRELWDEMKTTSDFVQREREVEAFNEKNRWKKRGIVMMPQKYGIAFTEPRGSLNSSSALIGINMADGSVIIHQGAVEMGQGVHTKLAQLAASSLGLPLEWIHVKGNDSSCILNTPATAASTGYDLNGGAVEQACRTLRNRLETFCQDLEQYQPYERIEEWRTKWSEKWKEIVFKAWFHRINLSSVELYKTPHYKGPSYRHPEGAPYLYFSYGVVVTEVEIDVLTGDFRTLRADVTMDACKSPNPALDIGQIEGGFVQGMGINTTEELIYDHEGRLVTDNIWSYKPPCTKTIPLDFRVRLSPINEERDKREKLAEKQAVKSSKALSESSMTMGASVAFAIAKAIRSARKDRGIDEWVAMDSPLTCQRIQELCAVETKDLTL